MTYIITTITNDSILMASDTRLSYYKEEYENGINYQTISATADCIRKTFYIESLNVGIQFSGIGYFNDGDEKYPLSYFIKRIENSIDKSLSCDYKILAVFERLKSISELNNLGKYIKGVMATYENDIPVIAVFNTFNNQLITYDGKTGTKIEEERRNDELYPLREDAINYINSRITEKSKLKPWSIGGKIEILEIKNNFSCSYIQECQTLYECSQSELFSLFNTDITKINGKILYPPIREEIK